VRKLAGGYIAWGTFGTDENADPSFTTWFSVDGRSWRRTVHAQSVVPCPGWTARPDLDSVYTPAWDGRTLVFTATYLLPDMDACDRAWMISLSTTDGQTWSRSQPFAPPHGEPAWGVWAASTWAIPSGWETLVSTGDDVVTLWRSMDLATWTQILTRPSDTVGGTRFSVLGAAPDGTRLAVSIEGDDLAARATLLSSSDGVTWQPVRVLPAGFGVTSIVPPEAPERPWLVAIGREDPEEARILVSRDLVHWAGVTFAKPGIRGLSATDTDWVAVGFWPQRDTGCGDSCRPERASLYTSRDGRSWINRPDSMPPREASILGTDGAAAVLAAGIPSSAGKVTVWRLGIGR
jgi:hypothetical protein